MPARKPLVNAGPGDFGFSRIIRMLLLEEKKTLVVTDPRYPFSSTTLPMDQIGSGYFEDDCLNMTYLHCLQHSLFEHLFNLYCIFYYDVHGCTNVVNDWILVPLNLTYLHCLQHSFFEHLFKLYYLFE